jgi:hypothetical protein
MVPGRMLQLTLLGHLVELEKTRMLKGKIEALGACDQRSLTQSTTHIHTP